MLRPTNDGPGAGALSVEYLPPPALKPYPNNARGHSKRQLTKLGASIAEFGFVVPVLIDAGNGLIAGHARVEAANSLGLAAIPCIRIEHLSEAQKRAFILADNRLTELASWDSKLLASELQFLTDLEFDVELTGFETAEIDLIIDGVDNPSKSDPADQAPAPLTNLPAVAGVGDLWLLGEHRVYCGDATKLPCFEQVLGGGKAQMVFTDPPYNVPISGHVSGLGQVQHREFAMASGEMSEPEFTGFLTTTLAHAAACSEDGAIHFVCMDWRHLSEIITAGRAIYSELKNLCVWNKDNGGMGSLYRSKHELIFVWKVGTGAHINNIELGRFGRYRANVWDYPGVNGFKSDRGDELAMHPTVKPVALVADAIRDCSKRGGIILDPFAGSGTTVVAAEKTGRRAAVIEIDPHYVDTIIRRWQDSTDQPAIHAVDGMSFADRERTIATSQVSLPSKFRR
jgi:16S rRNA G966 N2-methylase RsmD